MDNFSRTFPEALHSRAEAGKRSPSGRDIDALKIFISRANYD